MLITYSEIQKVLSEYQIQITGALHIGAHECEEIPFYQQLQLSLHDLVWIEAIPQKVKEAKQRGIPNVYHSVVTDNDDSDVNFHISNNGQSSSVLEFGTHSQEHPHVTYIDTLLQKSITIKTFVERNQINIARHNFWNFDIQGAELMALKGAGDLIRTAKAIYLEVNEKELYQHCGLIGEIDDFLASYGFKRVLTNITVHGWGDALYIVDNRSNV